MSEEKKSGSLMRDITAEKQSERGWKVEVNGILVQIVSRIRIYSGFGELNYGMSSVGYDGWSWKEPGGGGSVTIPYAKINGGLHLGVVKQMRHNQGGEVLNVPRGFLDPKETHFQAAERELAEETGIAPVAASLVALPGDPMNPNSTFFETVEPCEGVKFFVCKVSQDALKRESDGVWVFKHGIVKPVSKAAEGIVKCMFIYWKEAAKLSDMFTVAAVARLLANL